MVLDPTVYKASPGVHSRGTHSVPTHSTAPSIMGAVHELVSTELCAKIWHEGELESLVKSSNYRNGRSVNIPPVAKADGAHVS